jgi:hypothetical protein
VEDTYGNVVTTDGSTVTATVQTGTGPLTGTQTATAVSGVATFSALAAPTTPQTGLKLTFTDGSLTPAADTTSITVMAGTVTQMVVTLPGQTFTSGSGNSGTVTNQVAGTAFTISKLTATDQYLNIVTTYSGAKTITYTGPSSSPSGSAPSYTTAVSFTSGQSTTTLTTTLKDAQTTTISATDGTLTGVASSQLTVSAAAANKLAMKTEPSTPVEAGAVFSTQPAVYVEDTYGNVVTTDSSTVTATVGTGTGPLTGTTTATASSGVATFSGLAAPTTVQTGLKLTFTDGSLASVADTTSIAVTGGTTYYWVATGTTNFNSASGWSTSSGGTGGAGVPGLDDVAIFDGGSSIFSEKNGNCTITQNVNVAGISIQVSSNGLWYSGTITNTSYSITIGSSGFSQTVGTFSAGSGPMSTTKFSLEGASGTLFTAPTFTSTSGTLTVTGNFTDDNEGNANPVFTNNGGTVVFNNSAATTIDLTTATSFYNVSFGGSNTATISGGTFTAAGAVTLNSGSVDATTSVSVTGTGGLTASGGTLTFSPTSSSSTFAVTNGLTVSGGTVNCTTTNSGNSLKAATLSVSSGTFNGWCSGAAITVGGGSGAINLSGGQFIQGVGTDATPAGPGCGAGTLSGGLLTLSGGSYLACNTLANTNTESVTVAGINVSSSSSVFDYVGTGTITIGASNVSNSGQVRMWGGSNSSGSPSCGGTKATLKSSTSGTQRSWSGSGRYIMVDLAVTDQNSSVAITCYSCTGSNVAADWTIVANCAGAPTLVTFNSLTATPCDGGVLVQWRTGY